MHFIVSVYLTHVRHSKFSFAIVSIVSIDLLSNFKVKNIYYLCSNVSYAYRFIEQLFVGIILSLSIINI